MICNYLFELLVINYAIMVLTGTVLCKVKLKKNSEHN